MAETSSALATRLRNIRAYADLTLDCDGHEFKVHKPIVCGQSPVIAAALRNDFVVSFGSS